jgi:hypothetical protein
MKYNTLLTKYIKISAFAVSIILSSCEGLLDPIKDRDSGKDINLLIVDFNFFKTHISVNLYDATSKTHLQKSATLSFSGKNGADVVDYSGNKKQNFEVTNGRLELTVDPNVKPSVSSPLTFAITVAAEGYTPMSKAFSYSSDGIRTLDIYLAKISDGTPGQIGGEVITDGGNTTIIFGFEPKPFLKSSLAGELNYRIRYAMTLQDFLKLKGQNGNLLFNSSTEFWEAYNADPQGFMYLSTITFTDYPSWPDRLSVNGTVSPVILQILETGSVEYMSVNGVTVGDFNGATLLASCEWTGTDEPVTWGYAGFSGDAWVYSGKSIQISSLPHSYTLISARQEQMCATGAQIRFEAGFKSSFSVIADIFDMNGKFMYSQYFSGTFPATFTMENTPSVPGKLVFRNNNPSFKPLPNLEINNLCTGTYTVNVLPEDGYSGYQMVLKAFCPDNLTVAVAPTYSGEYRIVGSGNVWQKGFMQGGILDLLGKPDQEYEYRLLWENEWEVTNFHTTFNADGSYPYESDSKITSETLTDGRTRINISHTFRQSVCDTMNW